MEEYNIHRFFLFVCLFQFRINGDELVFHFVMSLRNRKTHETLKYVVILKNGISTQENGKNR